MAVRSYKLFLLSLVACVSFMRPVLAEPAISGGFAATILMAVASAGGAGWAYAKQPFGYRLDTIEKDLFPSKMNKHFVTAKQRKFRFYRWRLSDVELRDGRAWPISNQLLKERECAVEALVYDLQFPNRIKLLVKGKEVKPQFTVEGNKIIATQQTLGDVRTMCNDELELLKAYMRGCAWYFRGIFAEFKEIVVQVSGEEVEEMLELDSLEWSQLLEVQNRLKARGKVLGEKEERAAYLFTEIALRYVRLHRIILCLDEYEVARRQQEMFDKFYSARQRGGQSAANGQQSVSSNPQIFAIDQAFNAVVSQPVQVLGGTVPDCARVTAFKTLFDMYVQSKPALWPLPTQQQSQLLRDMHKVQSDLLKLTADLGMPNPTIFDMNNFWVELRRIGAVVKRITLQAG